jgi:hypothetical protein
MQELSTTLFRLSNAFLLGFAALSFVDGTYIHLIRLRLHARPDSWLEHLLHTGRGDGGAPWPMLIDQLLPGAVIIAGIHVWLAIKHRPVICPCRA